MNTILRALAALIIGISAIAVYAQNPTWDDRWLTSPGTTSSDDRGQRLCVDKRGNTYAAGLTTSYNLSQSDGHRVEVIKYAPDGTRLWRVDLGLDDDENFLGNIVTDDNYVYVCTTQPHSGTGTDVFVYKLSVIDGDGSTTWADNGDENGVRRFNSASTNNDFAADIALDSAGNVFVGGHCPGTNGDDLLLIKYAPTLSAFQAETWADSFETSNVDEEAVALDTLADGTTVVIGNEMSSSTAINWRAMKWSGGGSPQWSSTARTASGWTLRKANDVALSTDGSKAFLCGTNLDGLGNPQFAVAAFDMSDGSEEWNDPFVYPGTGNDNRANAIAYWHGFVYATGQYGTDPQCLTAKIVASTGLGSGDWNNGSDDGIRVYETLGSDWTECGNAIQVAGNGNVYVVGVADGFIGAPTTDTDPLYLTLCYDKLGNLDYERTYNGAVGEKADDVAMAVGLVGAGVPNLTGRSERTNNDGIYDFLTLRYERYSVGQASSVGIVWGNYVSGGLSDIQAAGSGYYIVDAEEPETMGAKQYWVHIEVTGSVPSSGVSELSLHFQGQGYPGGFSLSQDIYLYNYGTGQWNELDSRMATIATDSVVEVRVMGDPAPYINGSGQVKARIGMLPISAEDHAWEGRFNHIEWHYVQ